MSGPFLFGIGLFMLVIGLADYRYGKNEHRHPIWYVNLVAKPTVEVQVGSDRLVARARTASPEERHGSGR